MNTNLKYLSFFTILCVAFSLFIPTFFVRAEGNTEAGGPPDLAAIDAYLQSQIAANRIPGMAVAIVKDGEIIFAKGYGESAPGQPVTPRTQFYIGSVSKSFTALAAMQLVEEGKLDLDLPVKAYLPWFEVADPEASEAITVRNLLNHTSGLSELGDPHASAVTASLEEQARLLRFVRPSAPVGSKFIYYNQNYRLMGLLIEQVSGQSYGDYLKTHVLSPLGMQHTVADPVQAPALAQGYSRFFGFPLPQDQEYNPGAVPSGYLITTAEDLALYLKAQLANEKADGSPLLSSAALRTMRTPPAGIGSEYGMGWMVVENGNTLAHGGAVTYFQSFVVMGLKEKLGVVILSNQNSMENMLLEDGAVRDGLVALLNGETPSTASYGWVGWILLALAAADLFNHARLYFMLPRWVAKVSRQPRAWVWMKVAAGLVVPLAVFIGFPLLLGAMEGGSPTWGEGFSVMPDMVVWLLAGLGLSFVRSLIHAALLWQSRKLRQDTAG